MEDHALKEEFLRGEEVFHGALINVEHWQVRLPNGQQALREVVRHRGAAAIVPLDEAGNVTMVRQHRVAVDRFTWEIPAGKLDSAGEDMLTAAKRELEEETGLRAAQYRLLTILDTTPGFCTERIGIYLATGLSQSHMHPDEDEFLNVARFPLREMVARVMAGEIRDSKTIAGLLMAWNLWQEALQLPLTSASSIKRTGQVFSSRGQEEK